MKKLVTLTAAICLVTLSVIFFGGFVQSQLKEEPQKQQQETKQETDQENKNEGEDNPAIQNTTQSPQAAQAQAYTAADVAKHSDSSNCWLIINGSVYNVTNFIPQHPGGEAAIVPYCGKEASKAFATQDKPGGDGHSPTADALLKDYFIGNLQ